MLRLPNLQIRYQTLLCRRYDLLSPLGCSRNSPTGQSLLQQTGVKSLVSLECKVQVRNSGIRTGNYL